jgi:iron complex transport system ATP-binding protein
MVQKSCCSVLKGISFELGSAELSVWSARTAAEKHLIRCIDDILRPQRGRKRVRRTVDRRHARNEIARRMEYLPQGYQQIFSTTVFDAVYEGHKPHACWLSSERMR